MKSVMLSIQPKWVEKIVKGEKTIEVRKTRPKIKTPFKCYIYCTIGNGVKGDYLVPSNIQCGKVIGEFVCDNIEMVNASCSAYGIDLFYHDCITQGCLTERDIEKYFNIPEDKDLRVMKGNGYAWHISDLKLYAKPKELNDFWLYNEELHKLHDIEDDKFCCYDGTDLNGEPITDCGYCYENILNCYRCWNEWSGWCKKVTRPPQSYMYVEEI